MDNKIIDHLYNTYSWHEMKLTIILGVLLYGLCQHDKQDIAWITLMLPLIYIMIKNLMLFHTVSNTQIQVTKHIEKEEQKHMDQQRNEMVRQQHQQQQQQQQHQQHVQQGQMKQKLQEQEKMQQANKNDGGLSPPINQSFDTGFNGMNGMNSMGGMGSLF